MIGAKRRRAAVSCQTRSGRYSWARYYHPGLQRFISEDPIGFAGGDPDLYTYVGNNPISLIDSLGLRINWADQILRNPAIEENIWNLNDEIVRSGVPDSAFTLRVSGGDRYRDCGGFIRSASNHRLIPESEQDSRHLYENGAIAVDLVVTGITVKVFKAAMAKTAFDPKRLFNKYPNDPHIHIELPTSYSLPLEQVPADLSGRKDVCR